MTESQPEKPAQILYAEYGFGDVKKYDDIIYKFGDLLRIGEEK